jgi:putative heme iron utilization protein
MTAAALEARRFLRRCDSGALATISLRHAGYPFGSVVNFVPDARACPLILVSRLAEHSRNLAADPRCSLLVRDASQDVQASARVTVIADAEDVHDENVADRFVRYAPSAQRLLDLGDFYFVRLVPVIVRYIGGFGSIHWIKAADFVPDKSIDEEDAMHAISAHLEDVSAMCAARQRRPVSEAQLVGVDCDGFDARADGARVRFDFDAPAITLDGVLAQFAGLRRSVR